MEEKEHGIRRETELVLNITSRLTVSVILGKRIIVTKYLLPHLKNGVKNFPLRCCFED